MPGKHPMNRPMATATLTIDYAALAANWRTLDALTGVETAAVVKANGYGLGAGEVARRLARTAAPSLATATKKMRTPSRARRRATSPAPSP